MNPILYIGAVTHLEFKAMKRKWVWIICVLVLVLGAVGAFAYYNTTTAVSANDSEGEKVQTATVRQGNITISATGAGTVIPAVEISLSFPGSGLIAELLVQVGDEVQAGDVLARLDDTDAQETLLNAQLQLAQAAMQTDASATEVGMSFDDISIEQARLNLEEAQTALDDLLNWDPDPDEIAQAEANLAAAEASYSAARGQEASTYSNSQISAISLEQAKQALVDAQAAYETAYDPGREWELYIDDPSCKTGEQHPNCTGEPYSDKIEKERASAESAVSRAQDNLEIAQLQYNSSISSSNSSSSTSAQGNVLSAELALAAAQSGPAEDEIDAAKKAVRQAELALQQAQLNRESNQLSLEQAKMNVPAAEAALAETNLTAPMAGTIMAVNGSVGETAGGDLIILANLEQPLLEIYLDETDLDKTGLDFEVEVEFDALPDETFTGHIIQVDPQLNNVSGVSAIRALVLLAENSFAKPQTLPVGLNATVEVIGGRANNALLVPVEAVRELSPGQYAVFVMENGEPKMKFVEVGLMDFTHAEILSGLELGEVVTTGLVETE
jgi:HlyD family secretion protein